MKTKERKDDRKTARMRVLVNEDRDNRIFDAFCDWLPYYWTPAKEVERVSYSYTSELVCEYNREKTCEEKVG